jgi:hypothetical protein
MGGSAIAYAAAGAIPGANGVIQGCYAPQDNYSLRVTSTTCPRGTVPLSWNQQGPQGTPGTNGTSVTSSALNNGDPNCPNGGSSFTSASGTTYACNGAKGDTGPSDAYTPGAITAQAVPGSPPGGEVTLASLTLDPGAYVFTASVRVLSTGSSTNANCDIESIDTHTGYALANVNLGASTDRKILPLTFATDTSIPATYDLVCFSSGGAGFNADEANFVAIKVGSLTVQ